MGRFSHTFLLCSSRAIIERLPTFRYYCLMHVYQKWQSRFFDSLRKKGPLALFLFVPARVLEEFFGKSKSGSPWSGEGHPAAEPRKECVWEESPGDCPCKRERRTRWALRGADCRTGSPSCSAWPGMHRPSYLPSHDTCPSAPNMPRYKSFSQNIIDI